MGLFRQLIGQCATFDPKNDSAEVDITGLIRRLILFDTYLLQSIRLKEIPHLLNVFGFEGLIGLLKSSALRIHCDAVTIAQVGQTKGLSLRRKAGLLPLNSYSFVLVRRFDWRLLIEDRLSVLDTIDTLTPGEKSRLRQVIQSVLVVPPDSFGDLSLDQLQSDLDSNIPIMLIAAAKTLTERLGTTVAPSNFKFVIHRIDDEDFKVETDISDRFGLDQLDEHQVIERALLSIGGLNQRIEEMRTFSAISGFLPGDLPIFGEKLDFLAESLSPQKQEQRFQRILDIRGFPELDRVDEHTKLDVDKLLEIRDSEECRQFRAWLSTTDSASDSAIRELIASLRARLSAIAHTKAGKNIRFLVTTGIGFAPVVGNVAGTGLSLLDHFLLDKVLPHSGPATFINAMYPSIFEKSSLDPSLCGSESGSA